MNSSPNVIVVLADDMGWGDLGCFGADAVPTPNIDRIAAEGVRCTDAHSSSAVCSPSRYSVLTGEYAWRGPLKRGVLGGHGPSILRPEHPTIASTLRDAGYATAAVGKWHLGLQWSWRDGIERDAFGADAVFWPPPDQDSGVHVDYTHPFTRGPLHYGFDRFFGIAGSLDMPPYCFLDQDRTLGIPDQHKEVLITSQRPGLQTSGWQDDQTDIRFTEEAVRWIRERPAEGKPFFLYLAPAAPHRPCVPPEFIQGRSRAGRRGDAVCLVDWMVGRITAALEEIGRAQDTLIIITSDNGAPTRFTEDGDTVHHRPNGPWRGQKADIWDGGHREPFVARWPGRIPAGTVREDLICLTDLFPTIAAAAGAALPEGAARDGLDLLPVLTGSEAVAPDRAIVHHSLGGRFALRTKSWKAAFCTGSGGGFTEPKGAGLTVQDPQGQLFDLVADPGEQQNLWSGRPDLIAAMTEHLAQICDTEPTAPSADPALRSALGQTVPAEDTT